MSSFSKILSRRSIRAKMFMPFFLVTVMFVLVVIFWASHVMKQDVEHRFVDSLRSHRRTIVHEIEVIERRLRFFGMFMADVEKLSNQFPNSKVSRSILVYTINFLRSNNMFLSFPGYNKYSEEARKELIQKGRMGLHTASVTEWVTGGEFKLSVDVVNPIETQKGIKDVVIISYPITQKFLDELKIRTGADITLIYKDKIVLSTLSFSKVFPAVFDKIKQFSVEPLLNDNNTYLTEWGSGQNMHKVLLFPLVINYKTWGFFAVSLPLKGLFHIQREIYIYVVGSAVFMLVIIGFMYSAISRQLTYPVKQLSIAADYMAKGDLTQRVRISSADEVGNLQNSFNMMAENLQQTHEDLKKSNAEIAEWNKTLERKVAERARKLQEIQQQLHQTEKLSAIGELVSGVAHEINNPLSAIVGFAQIMEMNISNEQDRADLKKIVHEAKRASKIVKNLLTYARREGPQKQLTQINELIAQTVELRAYDLPVKGMEIIQDLDRSIEATMLDPNQIKQVLLNILNNAMLAVESKGDKARVKISSRQRGAQIIIKISDNGVGIPEETLPKIFDPFYTTKEVGQGTGLGLSVSYGIIKEHDSAIEVETKVDEGSTFIITLPVIKEAPPAVEKAAPETSEQLLMGKWVLVVDDDDDALNYMRRFLKSCGCIVRTASNGCVALERLQQEAFDLIFCDIKMPVMDGKALYASLSIKMPEMLTRIIFATGDLVNRDIKEFIESTGAEYVTKPFDLLAIKNILCKVIY